MTDYQHPSPNCEPRNPAVAVIWLAVHTAEGATTAASLAGFLADPVNQVSYHTVVDDNDTIQCVSFNDTAWAMLGGNPHADQICCTGFAAWTRDEWMAHRLMLDQIAAWLAMRAAARGIPIDHIGPAGVANRSRGVIGHVDYTVGANDGTHTDPGPNFPWDYVIARAAGGTTTGTKTVKDLDMPMGTIAPGTQVTKLTMPIGPSVSQLVAKGWLSLASSENGSAQIWVQGTKPPPVQSIKLVKDRRWVIELPDGTDQITLHTDGPGAFGWCVELQSK